MDYIHDEISRQASGVPPCFTKVPLPFAHKPNLGNEHIELNPLGLFFVLVVVSCTLDLLANFQWAGHWIYHLWYLEYCDLETHPPNIMGFLKIWEGNFKTTKRDPGFLAENVFWLDLSHEFISFTGRTKLPETCVWHLMFWQVNDS